MSILRPACVALLAAGVPAASIAQAPTPTAGSELRVLHATQQDVADGQAVARSACAGCHGIDGVSAAKGIPNIAGQRAVYMYTELRDYQRGLNKGEAMTQAVKFLSDDAIVKAAAYYASLDPPPPAATKAAPPRADPVALGKAAAAACAGCHGESGTSAMPGTPSLAGLHPAYLADATKAYKSARRKSDVMQPMVAALSDADASNIALYYALQAPARTSVPPAGDAGAGKAAAGACAGCHGESGVSATPATPSLAGQDAQYLATALAQYKAGSRGDDAMKGIAAGLDEAAMRNLAAHYASLAPQPVAIAKPLTTAQWAERCDRCHGANGNSTDPRLPAIAGQREDYLRTVLSAYRSGSRKSSAMAAMSGALGEQDVDALAAWYARQRPRAVIYVPVPAR